MSTKPTVSTEEVEKWFEDEEGEASSPAAPQSIDAAEKYARSQLRVVRETKDYQLDYLKHALQPGKELIDTAPGYQRRLRWTNKKRSLLIESFLLTFRFRPFFSSSMTTTSMKSSMADNASKRSVLFSQMTFLLLASSTGLS